jgi:hypothetical protein
MDKAVEKLSRETGDDIEMFELKHCARLLARGLSPCCEAPIDKSRVIRKGRHRGHGPRICSKCHQLVFFI